MSRSRKLPILKDKPRNHKKSSIYWRTVRRVINDRVRYYQETMDEEILPEPKEVVNDYDYSDYIYDMRDKSDSSESDKDWGKRFERK